MREAGAGTNNYSLAHMREERLSRLEKKVKENSSKLFKPETSTAADVDKATSDDSTSKIQDAKSIVHEYKKQAMDGAQGTDFSTNLDKYD